MGERSDPGEPCCGPANLPAAPLALIGMRDLLIIAVFVAFWVLLQAWLLPLLGVKT